MSSQDDLPTGNFYLAERIPLLLRRDYFYTDPTRSPEDNPLLLNVTGYLAISVLVLAFSGAIFQGFGASLPGLWLLVLPLLGLFFLSFALHFLLWTLGSCWRIGRRFGASGS